MNIYSETNMPKVPREIGAWTRIERVDAEGSKTTWRLTFENAVGGSIGYRFNTKRAAVIYSNKLALLRQEQNDAKLAA